MGLFAKPDFYHAFTRHKLYALESRCAYEKEIRYNVQMIWAM